MLSRAYYLKFEKEERLEYGILIFVLFSIMNLNFKLKISKLTKIK